MPNFAATVGFCRAIEALVKALPFGMVNESHEAGALIFMHPEMTVAGAPINPCPATADA